MKDKHNEIVGKCKYCGDPIYRFQVEAHGGCVKVLEKERIRDLLRIPPDESAYCMGCFLLEAGASAAHDSCRLYGFRLEDDRNGHRKCPNCKGQTLSAEVESDIEL